MFQLKCFLLAQEKKNILSSPQTITNSFPSASYYVLFCITLLVLSLKQAFGYSSVDNESQPIINNEQQGYLMQHSSPGEATLSD